MKQFSYRPFENARRFVHKLELKGGDKWREYCKSGELPKDIPKTPHHIYKNKGWKGVDDWLGTGKTYTKYLKKRTYVQARKFVRKQKLNNQSDWQKYCISGEKPQDIPASAERYYKKQGTWIDWPDFLGTDYIANQKRKYLSFIDAKKFVHSLKIPTTPKWVKYTKSNQKPDDIPADPTKVYKKEWTTWGDFLGTGKISNQEKAKIEARKIAKELGIKTMDDWFDAYDAGKIPKNMPKYLHGIYNPKQKNRKKKK